MNKSAKKNFRWTKKARWNVCFHSKPEKKFFIYGSTLFLCESIF